ncbi:MAG: hypothetical protein R3B49_04495 [Phycisphaerales bacterium]
MIFAVCDIDEVIKLIRESRTREEAIQVADGPGASLDPRVLPAGRRRSPRGSWSRVRAGDADGGLLLTRRVQAETIGGDAPHPARRARDRAAWSRSTPSWSRDPGSTKSILADDRAAGA